MGGSPGVVTEPRPEDSHAGRARRVAGRLVLALVGLALVAYLVREAGPDRIVRVLWRARSWLPFAVALELLQLGSDFFTLRTLLRDRKSDVPAATWVRSSAIAYAMMILVPAGRAAGEVTRATLVAQARRGRTRRNGERAAAVGLRVRHRALVGDRVRRRKQPDSGSARRSLFFSARNGVRR